MIERIYQGRRMPHAAVRWYEGDGRIKNRLDARLELRNHAPAGFDWGCDGAGPAQLALALLVDALSSSDCAAHWFAADRHALDLYQDFKDRVVTLLPREGWTMTRSRILAHVALLDERLIVRRSA